LVLRKLKKEVVKMAENKGSILAAFLAGLIVGGVVALLFAPASGEEVRRRIREEAEEKVGKVKEEVGVIKEKVESIKGPVEEKIGEISSKAKEILTEKRSQLSETLEKAKETIKEKKEELAEKFFKKEEEEA
jgi:gas vesicle protein